MADLAEAQCPEPGSALAHGTHFAFVKVFEILPHIEGTSLEQTFLPKHANQEI